MRQAHCGAATRPSVPLTTSAPTGYIRLGAQWHGPLTGCLRFAARVAPAPRKTRFRPLAKLYRAGVKTPQGSNERFPRYNRFLLSQAFLAHSRVDMPVGMAVFDPSNQDLRRRRIVTSRVEMGASTGWAAEAGGDRLTRGRRCAANGRVVGGGR